MKVLRWLLLGSIFALVLLQPGGQSETGHASGSVTLVRLNEVSFDPTGGDLGQEWVEVVNRGLSDRDLTGWTVSDDSGAALATLPSLILPPNAFLVVHFGVGTNDLDFSDGEGHFYTGSAIEAFDNLEDELALYDGAPGSGTIVDFMAYSFAPPFTPGVAHDWAVLADIWDQGDYFPGGVPLDEGTSLGRDSLSTDTDTSADWESDGGVEADGPTPGQVNLDILFSFQVAQTASSPLAADPAPLAADPSPEQEMLKKVLTQIKNKHMGVFPPGTVDPGFAGWDGQTFEQGNNSVKIDNIRFDLTTGLTSNGRPAAGNAPPPSTPTGLGHVRIDKGKADLVEWKWKEVVVHELVHVELERDTSGGYWRWTGMAWVPTDSGTRTSVNDCQEVLAYTTNLKLLQELVKGANDATKADMKKRMKFKVKMLDAYLKRCQSYLDGMPKKGADWENFGKHLNDLIAGVKPTIEKKKTEQAVVNGSISVAERAFLVMLCHQLHPGLSSQECEDYVDDLEQEVLDELKDTDEDGLPDVDEAVLGTDPSLPDSDGDGLTDGEEAWALGPGTDPLEPDSDADTFLDGFEVEEGSDPLDGDSTPESLLVGSTCFDGLDNDLDGLFDEPEDPSCWPDDADQDGVRDPDDNCPLEPNPDQLNSDVDPLGDACDEDDDDDGFLDEEEEPLDSDPLDPASTPEHYSVLTTCTDGLDNNLDSLVDEDDAGCLPLYDGDGDGIPDPVDNCPEVLNPDQSDNDGDMMGDPCDEDDDNDGIEDGLDTCPTEPEDSDGFEDDDGCPDPDNDADGVPDENDNCPNDFNPGQEDFDTDELGDACDPVPDNPDIDGDTVVDGEDNCVLDPNPDQADLDGDGMGDVCDPCPNDLANDEDADSHCADVDNCPYVPNPGQEDMEGDEQGDICDNCPMEDNPDQTNTDAALEVGGASVVGDALGDACDGEDDNDSQGLGPGEGFFRDDVELFTGTDPLDDCPNTATANDERGPDYGEPPSPWPPDFNDTGKITSADLVLFRQHYVPLDPAIPYDARYDLNASDAITSGDLVVFRNYWVGSGHDACTVW